MKDSHLQITGNQELDQATMEVLDDEIKLLDEDMRLLEEDLEALRRKRDQFADWRQKLQVSSEVDRRASMKREVALTSRY